MTKTEPKYRAGDIVTVKLRVVHDGPDVEGDVYCEQIGASRSFYVLQSDIVSVEPPPPPPLKVGDRARNPTSPQGLGIDYSAEIVAIDDGFAWLKRSDGTRFAAPLFDLVRA